MGNERQKSQERHTGQIILSQLASLSLSLIVIHIFYYDFALAIKYNS